MYDLKNKYNLKTFLGEIDINNPFNQIHQIVRVKFNNRYFDFRYKGFAVIPNPGLHLALITTTEEYINSVGLDDDRQERSPGIINENGDIATLPLGWVEIINKNQTYMNTNPQNGSSSFSIENGSMSNKDSIRIAITPPLNRDYTNSAGSKQAASEETEYSTDLGDENIGLFINNDSILIKTKGSSITMGQEGLHIGGRVMFESSEHVREWMFDNTLKRFIPSTIPTAAISIDQLPNVAKFARYAQIGRKIANIVTKTANIKEIIS